MKAKYPFQSLKLSIAAICEYAIESRGRWTLVGTFRQLEFVKFPATLERMEVYLLFTDVTDPDIQTASISLWAAMTPDDDESSAPLVKASVRLRRPSIPAAFEASLCLTDVVFPTAGCYDLYIEVDHEVYDLVAIHVRSST